MGQIANYSENRLNRHDEFELYEDRILVRGKHRFSSEYEIEFPLSQLNPSPARVWAGDKLFQNVLAVIVFLGFLSILLALSVFTERVADIPPALWLAGGLGLAFLGAIALFNPKKLEHATFYNLSGTPAFGMARLRSHASEFDAFLLKVKQQIHEVQDVPARGQV